MWHLCKSNCSFCLLHINVTDFINALQGNSSVDTVQHATIEEAVFSVGPIDAPRDWLYNDHVICVSCEACPFLGYVSDIILSVEGRLSSR
jgi:hypothetical protein